MSVILTKTKEWQEWLSDGEESLRLKSFDDGQFIMLIFKKINEGCYEFTENEGHCKSFKKYMG